MTVDSKECYTGYTAIILVFLRNPIGRTPPFHCCSVQATRNLPLQPFLSRKRRKRGSHRCSLSSAVNGGNEDPPAALSESARVQPSKCSQQVGNAGTEETPAATSVILSRDSRSPDLKPKPQTLNRKNRRLRRSEQTLALNPKPERTHAQRTGSLAAPHWAWLS
jgi:hypothetical protein